MSALDDRCQFCGKAPETTGNSPELYRCRHHHWHTAQEWGRIVTADVSALVDALAEYVEYLEAYLEYADDDDPAHEIINRRKEQLRKLRPLVLTPRRP